MTESRHSPSTSPRRARGPSGGTPEGQQNNSAFWGGPTAGNQADILIYGDVTNFRKQLRERVNRGRGLADEAAGIRAVIPAERALGSLMRAAQDSEANAQVRGYESRCARWMDNTREYLARRLGNRTTQFILVYQRHAIPAGALHERVEAAAKPVRAQAELLEALRVRLGSRRRG